MNTSILVGAYLPIYLAQIKKNLLNDVATQFPNAASRDFYLFCLLLSCTCQTNFESFPIKIRSEPVQIF